MEPSDVERIVRKGNLTVENHTTAMKEVLENIFAVVHQLHPLEVRSGRRRRPNRVEILLAATRVGEISAAGKEIIFDAVALMPAISGGLDGLSNEQRERALDVVREIDRASSLSEAERFMTRRRSDAGIADVPGLDMGLDVALQILRDGRDKIYSERHPLFGSMSGKGQARYGKADFGGAAGGAVGTLVTGCGELTLGACTAAAAAAGALTASAGAAAGDVWDAVWGDGGIPDGDKGDFPLPDEGNIPV